jgi:phage baseplate assembly protein W
MSTFKDLSLTLRKHPGTKDVLKKVDVDAVKESVKNILLSGPFDSPFDPNFGANIRKILFEPITPATIGVIKRQIALNVSQSEPRMQIEDIYVGEDGDNAINIGILFHVVGNPQQQTLSLVLERVR